MAGSTDERNAAILDAWDESEGATELQTIAARKFPASQFTRKTRVPVFLEHQYQRQRFDEDTQEVMPETVSWDRDRLAALTRTMNYRIANSGSFSPLSDGHTPTPREKAAGAKDPDVLGYQGQYRLGMIGNRQPQWAIFADEYHHNESVERLKKLTRRSPEVHINAPQPFFDPCAALGSNTPRLDMGTVSYSRSGEWTGIDLDGSAVEKYSMDTGTPQFPSGRNTSMPSDKTRYGEPGVNEDQNGQDDQDGLLAAITEALSPVLDVLDDLQALIPLIPALQKLALQQELPTPDAEAVPPPPAAQAPLPVAPEKNAMDQSPPGTPAQSEAPPACTDADSAMMAKYVASQVTEEDMRQYRDSRSKPVAPSAMPPAGEASKYQLLAEVKDLELKRDKLNRELTENAGKSREAIRYSRLSALRDSGYEFELAPEIERCSRFDDAQFEDHATNVVTRYSRLPMGAFTLPVMESEPLGGPAESSEERQRIVRYGIDHGMDVRSARKAMRSGDPSK